MAVERSGQWRAPWLVTLKDSTGETFLTVTYVDAATGKAENRCPTESVCGTCGCLAMARHPHFVPEPTAYGQQPRKRTTARERWRFRVPRRCTAI